MARKAMGWWQVKEFVKPQVMFIGSEMRRCLDLVSYVRYLYLHTHPIPNEFGLQFESFFIEEGATGSSVKYSSPCHFA